ncbi:sensor histidine kinase [Dyadobacter aurulentus]|uniref:sensor histidine kinase n=1 Tax=Dyadobacter sp. UC 10 TaxID=2605428 RepID=UPI0011F0CC52|nr:histidine kinase [Dyadobacter sp. UC 10]KAA0989327.1 sensor histidine kinase [Dyadobacter sp. UC 10]
MSKKRTYWTLQILGWTLLIMFEYVPYVLEYGFKIGEFYTALANILLGIVLTHVYRLVIRKWNWSSLPLPRLALRVIGSVLWLGLIMAMINQPMDREMLEDNLLNQPLVFWSYYTNWCKNLLAWILSYTVYHYVEQTRLAGYEKIMLKMSMREAEAKVLRSQLNPHFTFNALNSIRALVFEDPAKAQVSITQLSNILRNSLLADRRKTVDLQEELRTVEDYLELEKVRYEDRLRYSITADPQTIYWQVPPMMLQTLVENGIKHGVSKVMGGGFIDVKAEIANELLVIHIINSGNLGTTESGGVGLKNTAERLSILYGKGATFRIYQQSENIVCSEVKIPMLSEGVLMAGQESGAGN